tara:strand:+ start:247 stop:816 length:570 start_codon:yes stop_codon:yes gene_type:complete
MKNIIEDDTPADMLHTTVKTLCTGPLTHSNIRHNFSTYLYDNLATQFSIGTISLKSHYPKRGNGKRIFDYACVSAVKLDTWIEMFIRRYSISNIKLITLARRLTDNPVLIECICAPGLTVHSLRVCHGKLMRSRYPEGAEGAEGADQMIKKRVQMFHDTAQGWCDKVNEFIETCDKKAPMLCRSEHVNF